MVEFLKSTFHIIKKIHTQRTRIASMHEIPTMKAYILCIFKVVTFIALIRNISMVLYY